MEGKRAQESSVVLGQLMTHLEANPAGNVHGGIIMKLIDEAGGVVACRHARTNVTTASIDKLDFHSAVHIGNLLFFKARLNLVGKSSMEIGVRVEAENLLTGEVSHTASAYLTYVAIDAEGRPQNVPPLILETEEDTRRNREAKIRREMRLIQKKSDEKR
ncbi:MAG TPA: acyl-CoA thioesterase [Nitrospirota bacterium]|nr:acyl-CoA thioesterase [Nitrospirota bacterium]